MTRRLRAAALALAAVLALTGCGGGDPDPAPGQYVAVTTENTRVETVMVDGVPVRCIFWDPSSNGVAMWCLQPRTPQPQEGGHP